MTEPQTYKTVGEIWDAVADYFCSDAKVGLNRDGAKAALKALLASKRPGKMEKLKGHKLTCICGYCKYVALWNKIVDTIDAAEKGILE